MRTDGTTHRPTVRVTTDGVGDGFAQRELVHRVPSAVSPWTSALPHDYRGRPGRGPGQTAVGH